MGSEEAGATVGGHAFGGRGETLGGNIKLETNQREEERLGKR